MPALFGLELDIIKGMLAGSPTPKKQRRPGVCLLLLQRHSEHYSEASLDRAMQAAWHKQYDPKQFFAVAIPNQQGAVLHAFGAEISVGHFGYPMDWNRLAGGDLPFWAEHAAFTSLKYHCADAPEESERFKMYRGLGMLAAELCSGDTVAFFFPIEQVVLPNSAEVNAAFRSRGPLNPFDLQELA